ncbi:ATP-binding protein [bacterium]|nr:ATP-binding protein [bacterium]
MEIGITEAIQHFFSSPAFNLIYSEALANALDAGATNILININIESFRNVESLEIVIKDDGEGFTEKNFSKFSKLLAKDDKSHKGLGRLVYLKYFKTVEVESVFEETNKRSFVFDNNFRGESQKESLDAGAESYTKLTFKNFANKQLNTYENIKASSIKDYLTAQFLPRLFSFKQQNKNFHIQISTNVSEENTEMELYSETQSIQNCDLPELEEKEITDTGLDIFNESFKILYNITEKFSGKLSTAICVDGRAIEIPLLKTEKLPPKIGGVFLLTSKFLDEKTNNDRQELMLEPSDRRKIEQLFAENISEILNNKFPEIAERNKEVSQKLSSRYPHLEGYFSKKAICLLDENKTLDDAQSKFFKEQKEILGASELNDDLYKKSFQLATRTLAEYILYRNIIIEKIKNTGKDKEDKEAKIHNIITPMQTTLNARTFINDIYINNAWILDDKYMAYQSIQSDKNIKELISSISEKEELQSDDLRPDLALVFSDNIEKTQHPVDVVIVELKKKGLGYLDNTRVVEQLKQRARRLLGLYPDKIQRMWFFGIVEFDKELKIEMNEEWTPIYSEGESYYRSFSLQAIDKDLNQIGDKKYPVSLTLLSFDALWKDAKTRNDTFLTILRESIKKYTSDGQQNHDLSK